LFCIYIILSLIFYFYLFNLYILFYLSSFLLNSLLNPSHNYFAYNSNLHILSLASFILWIPFNNYYLHWSIVFAEFSNDVEYYGNFFIFKYNDNFLSKLFFYFPEYYLFNYVTSLTSPSNDCNLSINYYFYFFTYSSFYYTFLLNYASNLPNFSSIYFRFYLKYSLSLSNNYVYLSNVIILFWMSFSDFYVYVWINNVFYCSFICVLFIAYCILLIVYFIY